jgi:hypothetical protein
VFHARSWVDQLHCTAKAWLAAGSMLQCLFLFQGCSAGPFLMFYQGNLKGIGSPFFAPQPPKKEKHTLITGLLSSPVQCLFLFAHRLGSPEVYTSTWPRVPPKGNPGQEASQEEKEEPGGARKSQKKPGRARRSQEETPGGATGSQEEPGRARTSQEEPGRARRSQEEAGGARRLLLASLAHRAL